MYLRHSANPIGHTDLSCEASDMLELAGEDVHGCPSGVAGDQRLRKEYRDETQPEQAHDKLEEREAIGNGHQNQNHNHRVQGGEVDTPSSINPNTRTLNTQQPLAAMTRPP